MRFILLAAALLAAPAAAQSLPGIADEETTIPYAGNGGIEEFHIGKGDVMFVRDRTNRWYRIALNEGCLSGINSFDAIAFDAGVDSRLDRLSKVLFTRPERTCLIDSIRRSAPPPQVDQDSPVTLD